MSVEVKLWANDAVEMEMIMRSHKAIEEYRAAKLGVIAKPKPVDVKPQITQEEVAAGIAANEKKYRTAEITAAARAFAKEKGTAALVSALEKAGVKRVSEIAEDKASDFMAELGL